jgi:acyl dehydratase
VPPSGPGSATSGTRARPPGREPELDVTYDVAPHQALLYRLCGDRNPLHADPVFAERAGFPAPILHGLCSYGIVLRSVVQGLLDSDSSRVAGFSARFAGVVFPGETIRTRAWDEGDRLVVSASIVSAHEQRDGAPVLADCVLTKT